jgi:hypothetical protein
MSALRSSGLHTSSAGLSRTRHDRLEAERLREQQPVVSRPLGPRPLLSSLPSDQRPHEAHPSISFLPCLLQISAFSPSLGLLSTTYCSASRCVPVTAFPLSTQYCAAGL